MASTKLHGRAFYESIGSPKYVLAPMVDQSEFAWRMLTRSYLPPELRSSLLTYSPMLHAKLFIEQIKYRNEHFKPLPPPYSLSYPADPEEQKTAQKDNMPFQDGHPEIDRPLFVQFCANEPDVLLEAARVVAPYCDAVDLNLGCPQGIAKRGGYGAFLQEDWPTIQSMISLLHKELDIPITAKMRILETKERTLEYAKMIVAAGASILTVHGRQREQKGHNTGTADWTVIRYLRDNLPPETVMFANGNVLQHDDLQRCLDATGVDGVMSAEANLFDPSVFVPRPKPGEHPREYWHGKDGRGGWRMDGVLRRYLDIVYKYILCVEPPQRKPLWIPSDPPSFDETPDDDEDADGPPATKKQKRAAAKAAKAKGKQTRIYDVNLAVMQAHLFNLLRPLVAKHTNVRDALAKVRMAEMSGFEKVLKLTEEATKIGLSEYERDPTCFDLPENTEEELDETKSSAAAIRRCKLPFFVCQSYVRPLPHEAIAKGSMQLSKKEKAKLQAANEAEAKSDEGNHTSKLAEAGDADRLAEKTGLPAGGKVETVEVKHDPAKVNSSDAQANDTQTEKVEIPREGLVCG